MQSAATKPYALVFIPVVPFLFGVALTVSGITNVRLSVGIFELTTALAAFIVWHFARAWRLGEIEPHPVVYHANRLREWKGFPIYRGIVVLPEIFYALVVILICNLLIVEFIRMQDRRHETESANKAQLQQFYLDLGSRFWDPLPKDISAKDYDQWQNVVDQKIQEIQNWMMVNMGKGAHLRFVGVNQKVMSRPIHFSRSANPKHDAALIQIMNPQENLKEILETTAWDKPPS